MPQVCRHFVQCDQSPIGIDLVLDPGGMGEEDLLETGTDTVGCSEESDREGC